MRNPKNSWKKSDSHFIFDKDGNLDVENSIIGPNDMKLAKVLTKSGPEHRKFLRQIFVCVDITAPLYWWRDYADFAEFGTENSTSTMHKITSAPLTEEAFETNNLSEDSKEYFLYTIEICENLRKKYLETKDKKYWKELIRTLPLSFMQTRTCTLNYEMIYKSIIDHTFKNCPEWYDWTKSLPFSNLFED